MYNRIKKELTPQKIIKLVTQVLGAANHIETDEYIIFPTICHNINPTTAKMKLYYYKQTRLFHCYTQCGDSFDIFDLFKRWYDIRKISYNFQLDIIGTILRESTISISQTFEGYQPIRDKYYRINRNINLPIFPSSIMNLYNNHYPIEWKLEGISEETMRQFNIKFSTLENKIIIPHYDINSNLIGIRGRALNFYEIQSYGKYMPVKIEDTIYAHPLSLNLYGINFNKDNISRLQYVILVEGEKSVFKYEDFFGRNGNVALAVCGSNFNKLQLELLLRNFFLREIIIAFDKEYLSYPSKEAKQYFNKLYNIGLKYQNYCNFSFIYDTKNLLDYKDAPVDQGKETFLTLLQNKVRVK